jgi:LPS O-antigen subunit length determinant protein (WzzB/FepE family)
MINDNQPNNDMEGKTETPEKTSVKVSYSITKLSLETTGLSVEDNEKIFRVAFGAKYLIAIMILLFLCLAAFGIIGQPKWLLELLK